MEFDDIPEDSENLLDLEAEIMREQELQYEPMEEDYNDGEPTIPPPATPSSAGSTAKPNSISIDTSISQRIEGDPLKEKKSTVHDALNAFPMNKTKALNPEEFAKSIQEERRTALGKDIPVKNNSNIILENCSKLYVFHDTHLPFVSPIKSLSSDALLDKIAQESSMACNLQSGHRILLSDRVSNPHPELATSSNSTHNRYMKQLLSRPIEQIIKDYEEVAVQKMLSANPTETRPLESTHLIQSNSESKSTKVSNNSSMLWVDKYAPRSFTQLLSLEMTNREVLKAVKRWDKFVFKRDLPAILLSTSTKSSQPVAPSQKGKEFTDPSESVLDSDDRPRKKVILLCGPPGTGKTTLAHVIATHCGYRPLEINASDDRSPEAIKDLLARATQNETMDQDKRPNCIIIDEIDGLDGSNKASLEVLLQVLQAPLSSSTSNTKKSTKSTKAKSSHRFALTRPLICICNDLYAPALRDLRRLADIYHFTVPQDVRLVQRLQYICREEKVSPLPSTTVLYELIRATGYDIRSSINSLQFAAYYQQQTKLSSTRISSSPSNSLESMLESMMKVGLKDDHLDAYQIWTQIFARARPNVPPASLTTGISDKNSSNLDYRTIMEEELFLMKNGMLLAMDRMMEHGDLMLIIQGLHENVMIIPTYDMTTNHLHRHTYSSEWFSWTNLFSAAIISGNNSNHDYYSQYISLVAGATYYAHASSSNQKPSIQWPKRDKDVYYQMLQRQNILRNVVGSTIGSNMTTTFHQVSRQRIVLDVVSSLLDIIRPKLRSGISLVSYSKEEAALLQEVIEIMDSCGLHYQSTSTHGLSEEILAMVAATNPTLANHGSYVKRSFGTTKPFEKRGWNSSSNTLSNMEGNLLLLEPNLDLLVTYHDYTTTPTTNDASNSVLTKSTPGWKPSSFKNKKSVSIINNHPIFAQELRQVVFTEQRKYSIRRKEERQKEVSSYLAMEDAIYASAPVEKNNVPYEAMKKDKDNTAVPSFPLNESNIPRHGLSGYFTKRSTDHSMNEEDRVHKKTKFDPTASSTLPEKKTTEIIKKDSKIRYKFNEGFSNAVKRTVYLKDFL